MFVPDPKEPLPVLHRPEIFHLADRAHRLKTSLDVGRLLQGGERLVLEGTCALAVTITDVPELSPGTIERQLLSEAQMVTDCAPSHPPAA